MNNREWTIYTGSAGRELFNKCLEDYIKKMYPLSAEEKEIRRKQLFRDNLKKIKI